MANKMFSALREATKNLFRRPNTVNFPQENVEVPEGIRGAPRLTPGNCTLCGRCERICPTTAISIEKLNKEEGYFSIDLGKCCYCQECEHICNFDAIHLRPDWLTAEFSKDKLKTTHFISKRDEKSAK